MATVMFFTMMFFALVSILVSFLVIQARYNPKQNNSITNAGNKIIRFFKENEKALKKAKSITGKVSVIASLIVIVGYYIYTLPRNPKADKYVESYIQNSSNVMLTYVEPWEIGLARNKSLDEFSEVLRKYNRTQTIYTGFGRVMGRRAKLSHVEYITDAFQDETTGKYFQFMYVSLGAQRWHFDAMLRDGEPIDAKVNNRDLNDPSYGTPENPIPIMMWALIKRRGDENYEKEKITEEQYRSNVYYYLAYIMSKKKFNSRFEHPENETLN